ncbi:cupin domain-containing protein [Dongia soli]|uniref:AraC family transcriptional regulator n=1 Tax=Dongia soli TaxID=600628 RepID=A0ABU5E5C7_9PROT|nr:AraC family transcriptional regulator [Dongia soli]MDY0881503.1 AraC family transcriptional regulator [Dongia soli]
MNKRGMIESRSEPDDALSGLAPLLRVRPELESLCLFGAYWAAPHGPAATGWAPFHLVIRGTCRLEVAGLPAVVLQAGDIAILPHGDAHTTRNGNETRGPAKPADLQSHHNGAILVKTTAGVETETELICGRLRFEQPHEHLILATLPPVIVVPAEKEASAGFHHLMLTIREELEVARPGAPAIASDLASALLVMALRAHFEREPADQGLFALLGQRQSARAVAAMLGALDRDWTLDDLAQQAGTSRATLVRLFQKSAGLAPLAFLTELRLGLARRKLLAGNDTLAQIAAEIGYQSESAFSRAFQRRYGQRPGEMRRG